MDAQPSADDGMTAEVVLEAGVAVLEVARRRRERERLPARAQRSAVDQNIGHLGSEGARVAEHACAARARHADAEFESRKAAQRAVECHARHHAARAELEAVRIGDPDPAIVVAYHQPLDARSR